MTESIHTYFQIGTVSFMAYPTCQKDENAIIPSITKLAKDDYFNVIELNPIKNTEIRASIAKILKESHIKPCYGAQGRILGGGLNPNSLDEEERIKAEKSLLEGLSEAAELGSTGMAFLSGHWEESTKEKAFKQLLKTTRNVCTEARKKGIFVELEVFDFDIAKKSLIGPAPLAAEFAKEVRKTHSNFGLMVDLSHIPMCYETPEFTIRTLKEYITHFHIGNTVIEPKYEAYGDEHPRFGFENSKNDTKELLTFLKVLKNEGFFCKENPCVLSFEVKPLPHEDPEVILANSKRVLNRAWALLD